jgi:hypothetical protein
MTTISPIVIAQLRQIAAKLREHTIGSGHPTNCANNDPKWEEGKGKNFGIPFDADVPARVYPTYGGIQRGALPMTEPDYAPTFSKPTFSKQRKGAKRKGAK